MKVFILSLTLKLSENLRERRAQPYGRAGGQIKGSPCNDHPLDIERVCLTGFFIIRLKSVLNEQFLNQRMVKRLIDPESLVRSVEFRCYVLTRSV
jgi:hypothetical protein